MRRGPREGRNGQTLPACLGVVFLFTQGPDGARPPSLNHVNATHRESYVSDMKLADDEMLLTREEFDAVFNSAVIVRPVPGADVSRLLSRPSTLSPPRLPAVSCFASRR